MADITVDDITNSTALTNGSGIFDKLIQAVERHIESQFSKGRLAGTDYANVYLGSMQAVLQESVKFALGEQQADKQADLLTQQINSEIKRNEDDGVIDLEKLQIQKNTDLTVAKTDDQTYVTSNLRPEELAQAQTEHQVGFYKGISELEKQWGQTVTYSEHDITGIADSGTGFVDSEIAKLATENAIIGWKTIAELDKQWGYNVTATGSDITAVTSTTDGLIDGQIAESGGKVTKLTAETALLNQKEMTELAQTNDSGTSGYGTASNALTGIQGSQRDLYKYQSAAFRTKADIDIVKAMNDVWSVAYSIVEGENITPPDSVTGANFNNQINGLVNTDHFTGI